MKQSLCLVITAEDMVAGGASCFGDLRSVGFIRRGDSVTIVLGMRGAAARGRKS